jgi:hypothetical protein
VNGFNLAVVDQLIAGGKVDQNVELFLDHGLKGFVRQ